MLRTLSLTFLLFNLITSRGFAQDQSEKSWLIGMNLPIPTFESNIGDQPAWFPYNQAVAAHHVIRPGLSLGYRGIVANVYLVAINPFDKDQPDNTDYYLSPPGYKAPFPLRYNLGYQYSFGGDEVEFRPIVGAYYGIFPTTNFEIALGGAYRQHQVLLGVFMESNRHFFPVGDRWMDTSVSIKYQYRFVGPSWEDIGMKDFDFWGLL